MKITFKFFDKSVTKSDFLKIIDLYADVNEFDKMASTFAEKNQEFAKSTTDNAAQSGKKKKQSPFQGMYYCF